VADRLTAIGGRVARLGRAEAGDLVLAEFGCGADQVLLLGHIDTVWPVGQVARMPIREEAGRLYGPGVFDMKAGVGLGMLAARALLEVGRTSGQRIVLLLTTDEEIGSAAGRAAVEEEARRSRAVLVLEPSLPGGALKTSRKGCGEFQLTVSGVAAHAGVDPRAGASAIDELAHQILAIRRVQDLDRGISVNVGLVAGGSRPNVIAADASAPIDVRIPRLADGEAVRAALEGLRPVLERTTLSIAGGFDRPPLERTPAVVRLFQWAREVAAGFGRDLTEGGTGGGSDGNFTAAIGVPTLDGLGAVGDGAHALHEHVEMEPLAWRAALVAGLIERIGEADVRDLTPAASA
jgi:glutamate carboxypeptidase